MRVTGYCNSAHFPTPYISTDSDTGHWIKVVFQSLSSFLHASVAVFQSSEDRFHRSIIKGRAIRCSSESYSIQHKMAVSKEMPEVTPSASCKNYLFKLADCQICCARPVEPSSLMNSYYMYCYSVLALEPGSLEHYRSLYFCFLT